MKALWTIVFVVVLACVGSVVSWVVNIETIDGGIFITPWVPENSKFTTDWKEWDKVANPPSPYRMEISLEEYKADPQSVGSLVYVDCHTPHPYYVTKYGKAVVVSHEKSFPNPIFLLAEEVEYWDKGEFHWKFGDRAYWYYVTIGGVIGAFVACLILILIWAVLGLVRHEAEQLMGEEEDEST